MFFLVVTCASILAHRTVLLVAAEAGPPLIIWRKRRLYNIIVSVYTMSEILIWVLGMGEHEARAILAEQVSFFARTCAVASTRSEKHICQIH